MVFVSDQVTCTDIAKKLHDAMRTRVEALHAGRKQSERQRALDAFRSGDAMILVATNVAGRGLDVKDVKLVVNYEAPEDPEDYVHRIGRTGRAGQKGTAL